MPPELAGYRTLGQIGVGARSTITQAIRVTTGRLHAIKRVVRRGPDDDRFIDQAENEFAVSSAIDHPALRRCYEIHRTRKWFKTRELLIVMEFVAGKTLESERPTELQDVFRIFRATAQALDALHEAGFVHADIKPNNILLTDKQSVKIIDFGQSCKLGHKKDRVQGTPDYIAPEQVRRLPLDQRTDVFNLGATLYWVLTGKAYPTAIRQADQKGGHDIVGNVRSPKELVPKLPGSLSQFVMECCRDAPDRRPADMKQFSARLDAIQRRWSAGTEQVRPANEPTPRTP